MQLMPGDVGKVETPIWDTYKEIVAKHDERGADAIGNIERFAFYDEAKPPMRSSRPESLQFTQMSCCRKAL